MASASRDEHDVLIVGAGVIGLACAWRLAERGLDVVVLERERPGAGASDVAAGMLAPVGEVSWGEDRRLALALESHALWPRFAAELSAAAELPVGRREIGALHVALDGDEAAELRRRFELMRELGLEAEWLAARDCRELEPGLGPVFGGVLAPHEAAVDPRLTVAALVAALDAAGGRVVIGEACETLGEDDRVTGVRTTAGDELRAPVTVLAAGSWSAADWVPGAARPDVRPVKGQILALRGDPGQPACERIVVSERVYCVPHADGRLVVGATVEEQGFDTRVTAGGVLELLREAYRALPEVAELELVETIAGLRPATPDNLPVIGASAVEGLVVATGHYRNGILLAPLTADRVAAAVAGERDPVVRR